MWRLVGVQGVYNGRFFNLDKDTVTIGKGDGRGVSLAEDQAVAEDQAEILLCNGSYVFKDFDSACPTTVNGTVPAGMVALSHGDMVQIGESVFRVEQTEASVRATAGAHPEPEPAKGVDLSASPPKGVPWKLVTAVLFVTLIIATIAIPNIRRHAEGMRMAQDAVSSFESLGSAIKIGVSEEEYRKKVIDAQTKVDAYIRKFGKDEFGGLGEKLLKVQLAYVDAGELWDYKIRFDSSDFSSNFRDRGDFYLTHVTPEFRQAAERLLDLFSRYPHIDKQVKDGGAAIDSTYGYTGGPYPRYHIDTAMQIIWERASEDVLKLKL